MAASGRRPRLSGHICIKWGIGAPRSGQVVRSPEPRDARPRRPELAPERRRTRSTVPWAPGLIRTREDGEAAIVAMARTAPAARPAQFFEATR